MKKYSIIIAVFAFIAIVVSCGHPNKKKKSGWKKHKSELRMKHDTIRNDSVRQVRMKKWKEIKRAKKDSIK